MLRQALEAAVQDFAQLNCTLNLLMAFDADAVVTSG